MINVALTNLNKYNKGELVFEWVELPATIEEIEYAMEKIGIDEGYYKEYFISDYEASFEIDENANIWKLNDLAHEMLSNEEIDYFLKDVHKWKNNIDYARYDNNFKHDFVQSLHFISIDYNLYTIADDFISEETAIEIIRQKIDDDASILEIYIFLNGIESSNPFYDFYKLNGYENLESISDDDIDDAISEIVPQIMEVFDYA